MILIERYTKRGKLLGYDIEHNLVAQECTKCKEYLPTSKFDKHSGTVLGYNSICKICTKEKKLKTNWNARRRELRAINYISQLEKKREYKLKNKEKIQKQSREYGKKNYQKCLLHSIKWKKNHPEVTHEYVRRRELKKERASIDITQDQIIEMQKIYKKSQLMNKENINAKYQVDHIVPLHGESVSGLHVPWNLQILSRSENASKKNKFDGTYENDSWKEEYGNYLSSIKVVNV